jgi:hypothetical protein
MKKISVTLLAFALLLSPALAAKKNSVPDAPQNVCISSEAVIKADKTKPIAHLTGDDLVKFNKGYESATKRSAPANVDEVVAYDAGELVLLLGFSKGCGVGASAIQKKAFDRYMEGDGSSI